MFEGEGEVQGGASRFGEEDELARGGDFVCASIAWLGRDLIEGKPHYYS